MGADDARYDLTTLGETMLRISVAPGIALEQAEAAALHVGGAESNVACALAQLGRRVAWASRLPDLPTGRRVANGMAPARKVAPPATPRRQPAPRTPS